MDWKQRHRETGKRGHIGQRGSVIHEFHETVGGEDLDAAPGRLLHIALAFEFLEFPADGLGPQGQAPGHFIERMVIVSPVCRRYL